MLPTLNKFIREWENRLLSSAIPTEYNWFGRRRYTYSICLKDIQQKTYGILDNRYMFFRMGDTYSAPFYNPRSPPEYLWEGGMGGSGRLLVKNTQYQSEYRIHNNYMII